MAGPLLLEHMVAIEESGEKTPPWVPELAKVGGGRVGMSWWLGRARPAADRSIRTLARATRYPSPLTGYVFACSVRGPAKNHVLTATA